MERTSGRMILARQNISPSIFLPSFFAQSKGNARKRLRSEGWKRVTNRASIDRFATVGVK